MAMVILLFLLLHLPYAAAQWPVCGGGNYTSNSTYQANLQLLSSTLPKKAASNATFFATATVGTAADTVFALTLCRGDTTNASACEACVASAFQAGSKLCPYRKDVTVYDEPCLLRFSDKNFLATTVGDNSSLILLNSQNFTTSGAESMKLLVFTLLSSTALSAADSAMRFRTSSIDVSSLPTLYCLMQCTPDLTTEECAACFQGNFPDSLKYFAGPAGGQVFGTRCTMRYEMYPFFQGDPMLSITNLASESEVPATDNTTPGSTPVTVYNSPVPPAAAPPPGPVVQTTVEQHGRNSRKKVPLIIVVSAPLLSVLLCFIFSIVWLIKRRKGRDSRKTALLIIAVAAPLLSILVCFICSAVWLRRRRRRKDNLHGEAATNRPEEDTLVWRLEEKSSEFSLFDFSEILQATSNFSKESLLGQGGFGPVYKGQLPDGMEIAVKRLASHSGQGFTEFKNEVELIAKLQHNNLVKLVGCCIQGEEKLLVYEYLPNKSLDYFIFDGNRTTLIDWNRSRVIIEGVAQGLLYLHKHSRLRIIHRDLKASNILLDQDMNPKISDFGLAKIFSSNDTQGSTKRVVGTYGYMSPEYASEGIYSIKSDVFSFGVLLLEILSGKRNSGFHQYGDFLNLLGYSWQLWEGGRCLELLESSTAKEIHTTEARRYINIALMCVQECADDRPTMSDVVAMLNSESVVLPKPSHPAYFNLRVSKVHETVSVVVPCSNNDVTITAELDGR